MRRGLVRVAIVFAMLLGSAVAKSADLKLNYIDPEGAGLALTLVREPAILSWLDKAISLHATKDTQQPMLPRCRALLDQPVPCILSDTTASVLSALSQRDFSADLNALLASNHLVMDMTAPKTVLVKMDPLGSIQHIDFVGLVRGENEALPAPDAVSVFIVRISSGATISIVERTSDATVDINQIKFSSER